MQAAIQNGRKYSFRQLVAIAQIWKLGSTSVIGFAFLLIFVGLSVYRIYSYGAFLFLVSLLLLSIGILHARFLQLAQSQYRDKSHALEMYEIEFQAVFENTLDAILILDEQGRCRDANPSALDLLKIQRNHLIDRSIATFYPDQETFDLTWTRLQRLGHDRGQSEIVRSDGQRIFVEFTAAADFLPNRHLLSLRDVTERRNAELATKKSLALARSAWKEADMLRQATLALTQDLRMSSVLDTLLSVLQVQVPYEAAQVFLLETDSKLFLARETIPEMNGIPFPSSPQTLDVSKYPVFQSALTSDKGVLISDTNQENDGRTLAGFTGTHSWLGIRLCSSEAVIGLLCAAHRRSAQFTTEHLRITRSLAISAAVAIQNARLYERTEIYASQLGLRGLRPH